MVLIATMVVAARLGHKDAGYLITNDPPGAEYTINLAAVCAVVHDVVITMGAVILAAALLGCGAGTRVILRRKA